MEDQVRTQIIAPALHGLQAEGERYIGILYCGLMWTENGPYVIEFNARFGDPETQVLMPRVSGDFAAFLKSAADGAVDPAAVSLSDRACVGIVLATADYPRSSTPLSGLPRELGLFEEINVFWGTSTAQNGSVNSAGGRVLTVTALGDGLASARSNAYSAVSKIAERFGSSTGLTFRRDIALAGTAVVPPK